MKLLSEAQALFELIQQNYRHDIWCLLPNAKRDAPDFKAMAKLQILLGEVFGRSRSERELRLNTLSALLPILQHNGKPIEFTSSNTLWLAELYGLITWLEANPRAIRTLSTIAMNPIHYGQLIRKHLGFLKRPVPPICLEETVEHAGLV